MKPSWLKVKIKSSGKFNQVKALLNEHKLNTVCEGAKCPNVWECWCRGTATFMILGDTCTRNCNFCSVFSGKPGEVDNKESSKVAAAIKSLNLKYAVVTSVTRDDLKDGGAEVFESTIKEIKKNTPQCKVEVLVPDFSGSLNAVKLVAKAKPDVFAHNLETIPRLYKKVRPKADYKRSLKVLQIADKEGLMTKSGMMLGMGETFDEILQTMNDLRRVGCQLLTLGQYLQPTNECLKVERYVTPAEFDILKDKGLNMGFTHVESGPLVRSSYFAERAIIED